MFIFSIDGIGGCVARGILIKVNSFDNYRPRKEIKHPHWFKCSNRLLEDEDFYDFSFEEIAVWIYILSVASQKDDSEVFINFEAAERKCRLKEKVVRSAIEKLSTKQIDVLPAHDLTTSCTRSDHDLTTSCVLDREEGEERRGVDQRQALPPLVSLWNENRGELPKVKEVGKKRKKQIQEALKECPDLNEWREAIKRIAASDFCNGKVDGKPWCANFDYLLRDGVRIRVLEGEFDNRRAPSMKVVL